MNLRKSLLLAALVCAPVFGQTKTDKQDIQYVRLTMPKIQTAVAGFTNLAQLLISDPGLAKQMKEIDKSLPENAGDDRFSLAIEKLQAKDPRVGAAFAKAGMPPKEASVILQILVASAMGEAMLPAGQPIPKDTDPILAENVKFCRLHKEELTQAMQKFQAISTQLSDSDK